MDVIKVKGTSRTSAVAGAIAVCSGSITRGGSGDWGQRSKPAVKAMALARNYLSQDGIDVVFTPSL
jgi:stage V sporulation protein S